MAIRDVSDRSITELISLADRNAVVTGAARGIGFAISRRLAEAGAKVVLADINDDGAEDAAVKIRETGGSVTSTFVDVSDTESIIALLDTAETQLGGIDIWVNNAGIFPSKPLLDIADEDWDRVLNINLRGMFVASR